MKIVKGQIWVFPKRTPIEIWEVIRGHVIFADNQLGAHPSIYTVEYFKQVFERDIKGKVLETDAYKGYVLAFHNGWYMAGGGIFDYVHEAKAAVDKLVHGK